MPPISLSSHTFFLALSAQPQANENIQCISPFPCSIAGRICGFTSTYSTFSEPNATVHYRMLGAPGSHTMAAHSSQKVEWVERQRTRRGAGRVGWGRDELSDSFQFSCGFCISWSFWVRTDLPSHSLPLSFFFCVKTFPWIL